MSIQFLSLPTLICIFLESSKVALSNGYLTLKIQWAFEERITSQAIGVIFAGVLGLKLVTQLRNFERLYFRWFTINPIDMHIFGMFSKIALSFGTLTKIIRATFLNRYSLKLFCDKKSVHKLVWATSKWIVTSVPCTFSCSKSGVSN